MTATPERADTYTPQYMRLLKRLIQKSPVMLPSLLRLAIYAQGHMLKTLIRSFLLLFEVEVTTSVVWRRRPGSNNRQSWVLLRGVDWVEWGATASVASGHLSRRRCWPPRTQRAATARSGPAT